MKFNAIVIGTGQAGTPLAVNLAKNGFKTAIIEKGNLGGTCVNNGCTPTKSYVACARRAFVVKNSKDFGIILNKKADVNLKKIKERKDKLVLESRKNIKNNLSRYDNITLYKGKAKFKDANSIEVNGEILSADKFFINVGGRPFIPEGFDDVNYLTNESILELVEIPEHLIIVGGGYNGLEFGQMFRRFGSNVTIIEKGSQLLKNEDKDIADCIEDILKKEGIKIRFNAECIGAQKSGHQIKVKINCKSGSPAVSGSHLLITTGRIPNTGDLGLKNAGIKTEKKDTSK